jgi:transcription-repair coupling factor (superfamily II helicase)
LSRFRSSRETRSILEGLKSGGIDIVIGTHRLLSKDVEFLNLGLVIIDEEQRFGVEHKEYLKKLRHMVDVLTMTATPIPRTLHSALVGLRDISNLETPPRDRLAVETRIQLFDPGLIRQAILHELNREGQVYFVNDRVEDIVALTDQLRSIVPEAKFVIGHGQMPEDELEEAMLQFLRGQAQVLVATTIVENGLDIPSANTIFIHRADRFGLADLHQLRGRVGRYKHRAYCYLLLDPRLRPTPQGLRRLKTLEEFSELGAGFQIAMRDLEIRGAGNILGTEQSGHIATVGYELYCQLLENAVRRLKKQPLRSVIDVNIALPIAAYLPRSYVPSERLRLELYRRLARGSELQHLADLQTELVDRFGPLPEPAVNLVRLQELRLLAARWQIASIHLEEPDLIIGYRHQPTIKRLAEALGGRLRLLDDSSASLRLRTAAETTPAGMLALLKTCLLKALPETARTASSGRH